MIFRARKFEFHFPRTALVMGVVNVTPDSFSDGGLYLQPEAAVEHALKLVREGADILDIGGESTRPRAESVPEAEELRRVLPVLKQLCAKVQVPISIDTMKPAVARAAVEAGVAVVNDVGAALEQEEMWRLVAETGAGYVCMHMQGTPRTMQKNPHYVDVQAEVGDFFSERLLRLARCGVAPEQIILDPGIGFGKTVEHNLLLLAGLSRFAHLQRPLLVGVSRKSFLGKVTGAEVQERVPAGLACACLAVAGGVHLVRTHDVAETVQALRMTEAILAKRTDV